MKIKSNEEGVCPFCNNNMLECESAEIEGNMICYPWKCSKCGHSGEEWYEMNFVGHNVEDENGNIIELKGEINV